MNSQGLVTDEHTSVLRTVDRLMDSYDRLHEDVANCIILGPLHHHWFSEDLRALNTPLKSDPNIRGAGRRWYRGCRVLYSDESGVWVGRVIEPTK